LYISIPFRIIDVEIDKMVRNVIGLITAIPTATGVSIFDAAIKEMNLKSKNDEPKRT
jgi:hypothetical protein